jgi:hypothetical protein
MGPFGPIFVSGGLNKVYQPGGGVHYLGPRLDEFRPIIAILIR